MLRVKEGVIALGELSGCLRTCLGDMVASNPN